MWKGYPKIKVAADGRYEELYSDNDVTQAMDALSSDSPKQAELLARLNPDFALICARSSPQSWRKQYPPKWKIIYEDESCRIWSDKL